MVETVRVPSPKVNSFVRTPGINRERGRLDIVYCRPAVYMILGKSNLPNHLGRVQYSM